MAANFVRFLVLVLALTGCAGGRDTPLTAAAASGDQPELVRLLAGGSDPDGLDGRSWTPLIWAVREGHHRLVGVLVDRGADVDLFAADDDAWTPLMHAVSLRQLDAVRALLNAGADPSLGSAEGKTPLMLAAAYGYFRTTRVLLERSADVRAIDREGRSALDWAIKGVFELDHITLGSCQTDTVRALVESEPTLRLKADSAAMRRARLKRCHEIVELVAE